MSERARAGDCLGGVLQTPTESDPVLFLHGQPGSAGDWEWVLAALPDQIAAFAIDRPGYDGRTPAGGLRESGEAAVAWLDAEGMGRATIVGLSFGGAVAAWIAAHHPERVSSLVLVSPAANSASLQPVDRLLGAPVVGRVATAAMFSGAGIVLASRRLRRRYGSSHSLPDDYLDRTGRQLRSRRSRRAFLTEQRALLRDLPALDQRLHTIATPTTIVIGTADTIVRPSAGRLLAQQIPGASVIEIDGAGHVLSAEAPARVAEVIVAATRSRGE